MKLMVKLSILTGLWVHTGPHLFHYIGLATCMTVTGQSSYWQSYERPSSHYRHDSRTNTEAVL
jgi:hypothetical protein